MSKVLLLLDHKENRRLLSQWLGMYYEVFAPDAVVGKPLATTSVRKQTQQEITPFLERENLLDEPFDLCILDGLALDRLWVWVQARKAIEQPVFLPVLLLTSRQEVGIVTRHLWRSVDELIISPIEKVELQARVEILLRSRQFSLQLKSANAQLQEHNQTKSRFVSILSHEFRNPLHSILTSTQIIERTCTNNHEKQDKLFQYIKNAVKKMTELIDEVLVISKAEAGKFDLNKNSISLKDYCSEIASELQISFSNKNPIVFISQGECPPSELDEKLLRHILTNLLSNAVKYSPDGREVYFRLTCHAGAAIFEIQDAGIGIPQAEQKQLFEPFHRASNASNIPGTGLGLAIVKHCVELHGGKIELNSEVGVGSTFKVTLPLG